MLYAAKGYFEQNLKNGCRRPDFIIGGAQKSGTTSLHYILEQHPAIYIAPGEVNLLSADDAEENGEIILDFASGQYHGFNADYRGYIDHYLSCFREGQPSELIGEDSTTYLSSTKAPGYIAALMPDVKLIFILRDPVKRTYSHYWHNVYHERIHHNFEESLPLLVRRSLYKPQIERYLSLFAREQLLFILFEEFLEQKQIVIDRICTFLGLPGSLDIKSVGKDHRNAAQIPRFVGMQLAFNRYFEDQLRQQRRSRKGTSRSKVEVRPPGTWFRVVRKLHRTVNPVVGNRYPPMDAATQQFLESYFAAENAGISDLIGTDVAQYWPYMAD